MTKIAINNITKDDLIKVLATIKGSTFTKDFKELGFQDNDVVRLLLKSEKENGNDVNISCELMETQIQEGFLEYEVGQVLGRYTILVLKKGDLVIVQKDTNILIAQLRSKGRHTTLRKGFIAINGPKIIRVITE